MSDEKLKLKVELLWKMLDCHPLKEPWDRQTPQCLRYRWPELCSTGLTDEHYHLPLTLEEYLLLTEEE